MGEDQKVLSFPEPKNYPEEWDRWAEQRYDFETFQEVTGQFIKAATEALKNEREAMKRGEAEDDWETFRLMARTEKLMRFYMSMGYGKKYLEPMQRMLRETLYTGFRMYRRVFIKRFLTCGEDEFPARCAELKEMREKNRSDKNEGEDFTAVERHLKEGKRLFEGLCEHSKRTSPGPPVVREKEPIF
jgi:hypothetical protein